MINNNRQQPCTIQSAVEQIQPLTLKFGNGMYIIGIHFHPTEHETLDEKMRKLIFREVMANSV